MYPVEFIVKFINTEKEYKIETEHGVTFAENYSEAARKIEDWYGDELVSMEIFLKEKNEIFILEDLANPTDAGLIKIEGNITEW